MTDFNNLVTVPGLGTIAKLYLPRSVLMGISGWVVGGAQPNPNDPSKHNLVRSQSSPNQGWLDKFMGVIIPEGLAPHTILNCTSWGTDTVHKAAWGTDVTFTDQATGEKRTLNGGVIAIHEGVAPNSMQIEVTGNPDNPIERVAYGDVLAKMGVTAPQSAYQKALAGVSSDLNRLTPQGKARDEMTPAEKRADTLAKKKQNA